MANERPQAETPTIYDWRELRDQIKELATRFRGHEDFFESKNIDEETGQGDVIALGCDIPFVDESGDAASDVGTGYWLVLGNSCSLSEREVPPATGEGQGPVAVGPIVTAEFTQLAPIIELRSNADLAMHTNYQPFAAFYIPPWESGGPHRTADLSRIVHISTAVLRPGGKAQRLAQLSRPAWVLLHCCMVRCLARADARYLG